MGRKKGSGAPGASPRDRVASRGHFACDGINMLYEDCFEIFSFAADGGLRENVVLANAVLGLGYAYVWGGLGADHRYTAELVRLQEVGPEIERIVLTRCACGKKTTCDPELLKDPRVILTGVRAGYSYYGTHDVGRCLFYVQMDCSRHGA